jgi:fructose-specific phosphotransferase system IIC component
MRVLSRSVAIAALTLMIPLFAGAAPRAAAGAAAPGLTPAWIARGAAPEQHAYSALREAPAAFVRRPLVGAPRRTDR